jgi:tetratricopeptide (TPR) repeat protein
LLGDAAVLGKTFSPQALAALSGFENDRLEELLTGMVRREVLGLQSDPRSPEQGQYTFLQDLLRHVAYETLPRRERRDKHLAAAEHLGTTLGDDEVAEVVASHLLDAYRLDPEAEDSGRLRTQAHEALLRAGSRAASLGASTEARRYFEQAAELGAQPGDRAAALGRAGEMALAAGDNDAAGRFFELAIGLYESSGDTHAAARVSTWLGRVDLIAGRLEQSIERLEQAYSVIGEDGFDADLALLLIRLGQTHFFAGNPDRAAELIERGLDIAEALVLPEQLVRGWMGKAVVVSLRHPEEARGLFRLACDTAIANELYQVASVSSSNLSDLALQYDRYGESLTHLEQALELARRIGDRGYEWFATCEMSYAMTMLGRWDEALAKLAEIPDEQVGENAQLGSTLSGALEIHVHRGRLDEARALLRRYEEIGRSDHLQMQACYQTALAAVRLAEGKPEDALTAAEWALATRETSGIGSQDAKIGFLHAVEAAHALNDRSRVQELLELAESVPPGLRPPLLEATAHRFRAHLAGDDPGADRHFTSAAARLRSLELPFYLAVVQLEHAEWLTARGRPDDAQPLLAEARETFERLGAVPWLERIDAAVPDATADMRA